MKNRKEMLCYINCYVISIICINQLVKDEGYCGCAEVKTLTQNKDTWRAASNQSVE